jgi:hypothetical protein
MPWTFAHPAAVIPLRRLCPIEFNFAALFIGALTPDAGYYVGLFGLAGYAHTLPGSFAVCLPIGLFLLACFYLLRRPVWHLLPEPHRALLMPLAMRPAPAGTRGIIRVVLSVLVGAWSHSAWDSVTHGSGWVVTEYPVLREIVIAFGDSHLPLYSVLQHLSTFVGVAVLLATYYRWLRREGSKAVLQFSPRDRWRYASLAGVLLSSAALTVPFAASVAQASEGYLGFRVFMFWSAVYGAVFFFSLLVLTAVFFYVTHREG